MSADVDADATGTVARSAPSTLSVPVALPIPRDPSAYAPIFHFEKRRRYRKAPRIKDWIVEECIEEGVCYGPSEVDPTEANVTDEVLRARFERTVWTEGEDHDFRVVVGIVPAAFVDPERSHLLITAYCTHEDCHPDTQQFSSGGEL